MKARLVNRRGGNERVDFVRLKRRNQLRGRGLLDFQPKRRVRGAQSRDQIWQEIGRDGRDDAKPKHAVEKSRLKARVALDLPQLLQNAAHAVQNLHAARRHDSAAHPPFHDGKSRLRSISAICADKAGCETWARSAARPKWPVSAKASK